MVIWIIGLSGSGKSTLGRDVFHLLKRREPNTVFVDGDEIRTVFGKDLTSGDYTLEARKQNADRICGICRWLDTQGQNVVCCIQSLFEESRVWNRVNYSSYYEVYLAVPMDILIKRNPKNLYQDAINGRRTEVVGVDIPFAEPENPDMVIDNAAEGKEGLLAWAPVVLRRAMGMTALGQGTTGYPYDEVNCIETPVSYSYSSYGGRAFISAWVQKRDRYIQGGETASLCGFFQIRTAGCNVLDLFASSGHIETGQFAETLINALRNGGDLAAESRTVVDTLVKRFEVTKKIYASYDLNCRPEDRSAYRGIGNYLWIGYLFCVAYECFSHLSYVNALLKLNDILCSPGTALTESESKARAYLLIQERRYIDAISGRLHPELVSKRI